MKKLFNSSWGAALLFFFIMLIAACAANAASVKAETTEMSSATMWPFNGKMAKYGEVKVKIFSGKARAKKMFFNIKKNRAKSVKEHKIFGKKKHQRTMRMGKDGRGFLSGIFHQPKRRKNCCE